MPGVEAQIQPDPTMERDERLPPTLRALVLRWLTRLGVIAFVLSLVLHVGGGFLSGFIRIGRGGGPPVVSSGDSDAPIGMALATESELAQLTDQPIGLEIPSIPQDAGAGSEEQSVSLLDAGPVGGVDQGLGGLSEISGLAGGGDIAGGPGLGGGGGGGGTSFFGVEATGRRFAFIVDISGSMEEANKIGRLKVELRKTVEQLLENAQFLIVAFSSAGHEQVLNDRTEWIDASTPAKRRIYQSIELLKPQGGTEPLGAFQAVMELKPRPDAIYFMTDGQFADEVAEQVWMLNRRFAQPVPVHCICFISQDGEPLMRRIAQQSKGTYTFVPGP